MRTPIAPRLFRHQQFSGNPPFAPKRYGWIVRLAGPATPVEREWLKRHGYSYSGGKWCRLDRKTFGNQS